MVIEMNKNPLSDHTERYRAAGLSMEFIGEMARAVAALKAAGYEPYDQLYGYAMHGNEHYITRFGGAREIVTKIDVKDIRIFLKHYKEHMPSLPTPHPLPSVCGLPMWSPEYLNRIHR